MLITYHGHSEFLVETKDGKRILFDPFPAEVGYTMRRVKADVVAVSHHHFDHCYTDKVDGKPVVVDTEGMHTPMPGIRLLGVKAWHDEDLGRKRGQVVCFILEADWLKVLHLGDLGQVPDEALRNKLFMPDVLLVPIGGTYTLDAQQAKRTIELLQPRVIIPMHYRNEQGGFEQIDTIEPFLEAMRPLTPSVQPVLRVTREDLSQQPRLVQLTIR